MRFSDQTDKIVPALVAIAAELEPVTRDAVNPFFKSRYATASAIDEELRPLLAKHGCMRMHGVTVKDGSTFLTTRVVHESGQWAESDVPYYGPVEGTPQEGGGAMTYAMRYGNVAFWDLPLQDDDGNSASMTKKQARDRGYNRDKDIDSHTTKVGAAVKCQLCSGGIKVGEEAMFKLEGGSRKYAHPDCVEAAHAKESQDLDEEYQNITGGK